MVYKYTEVEVEVDLEDFSDEELIEEIQNRKIEHLLELPGLREMWYYYSMHNTEKFEELFRELLWKTIGKTI